MVDRLTYRELLRIPRFVQLWLGQAASLLGDSMARIAVPVLAVGLTHSNVILGLSFTVQALPWFLMAPVAGILADSMDRRRIVRLALLGEAAAVGVMAALTNGWWLLAGLFIASSFQVIQAPARSSALPALLGKILPLGAGLVAATVQIGDVAGQTLGGLLLAQISARSILVVDVVTFVIFAVAVPPLPNATPAGNKERFISRLTAGTRLLLVTPAIRRMVVLMAIRGATVTPAVLSLLYALTRQHGAGVVGFGLTSGVFTATLVIGSLVTGRITLKMDPYAVMWITTGISGVCLLPIWFHAPLIVAAALIGLMGLFYAAGNVIINAEMPRLAPEAHRGQVVSASWALIKAGQVVGGLLAAWAVGTLGAGHAIALAGGVMIVGVAVLRPARTEPFPVTVRDYA